MANVSPAYIAASAKARGLDPNAVLAVSSQEGAGGGVGDNGTSFGPFQLHYGGAYPSYAPHASPQAANAWAWSPQGVNYALDLQKKVAGGLTGHEAITSIVQRFERPANAQKEIAGAMNAYGHTLSTPASAAEPQTNHTNSRSALVSWALDSSKAFLNNSAQPDLGSLLKAVSQPVKAAPNSPNAFIQGPASPRAKGALALAQDYIGTPYKWGGESPNGFDCSGLLQYVWSKQGVSIPRTSYDQFTHGIAVNKSELQPGDAVFFTGSDPKNGLPGHVGMYIGGGRFVEAPHSGSSVHVSYLQGRSDFVGARRFG